MDGTGGEGRGRNAGERRGGRQGRGGRGGDGADREGWGRGKGAEALYLWQDSEAEDPEGALPGIPDRHHPIRVHETHHLHPRRKRG